MGHGDKKLHQAWNSLLALFYMWCQVILLIVFNFGFCTVLNTKLLPK